MPVYLRPTRLDAALAALAEAAAPVGAGRPLTVIAGATDIYPARAAREAWLERFPRDFLDVTAIPELHGIHAEPRGIAIGAATPWTTIAEAELPGSCEALQQAAVRIGGRQIQNRGTLGGNICNASPAADGTPPLIALDARLRLASRRGEREVPLASFLRGNRRTDLGPDELLTHVLLPTLPGDGRSLFLKLGARTHLVIAIVSVAAHVMLGPGRRIADVRLVVGACSPVPQRLAALEAILRDEPLGPELARHVTPSILSNLAPIDDVRASAAYRIDAALILVKRALAALEHGRRGAAAA